MAGLLRICTAGSVDDGKSTLIGRLLYESRGLYEDQVRSVEAASRNRGVGPIDYSLFTDGLKAEREQGITIDVAYRYFATARRTFILADSPGHEQYTRNMATAASTAELAILLVDARNGIRPQSRHHARIARLLGVREFVLAVNKMDLVNYEQDVFESIAAEFAELLPAARLLAIPVSALLGDNVTARSERTPWYSGPALLEYLEGVAAAEVSSSAAFRFPVQLVLRPDASFRGYAGQVASGTIRPGDAVTIWPSRWQTRIARILTRDGELARAEPLMSVVLTLTDEIDVSRGDWIATGEPMVSNEFDAELVWMDERPLDARRIYLLKQGTRVVTAEIDREFSLNQTGAARVTTSRPLVFDPYQVNRASGSFILVDPDSCFTAAAGMIKGAASSSRGAQPRHSAAVRIALAARHAATEDAAVARVRTLLEEALT